MMKRKALGRGLSALIPDANGLEESGVHFFQCPIEAIKPNPYQPRQDFSERDLAQMAESMKDKGVLTPLLVSKGERGFRLIAGERRWRAAQKAGLDRVPVVVREAAPLEALELAIVENIHRKDLNPVEEAQAYSRLMEEAGLTQEAVAKRVGKDRSTVANLLRLLRLPSYIQKDLIEGRLSMAHARVLAGVKTTGDQRRLRDLIIAKSLSVRQAEGLAQKRSLLTRAKKTKAQTDAYLASVEEGLKRSLGTKVEIRRRGKAGRIVIHFYSDEELDRLLEVLG